VAAVSVATALLIASLVTLLQTRRYTARVTLLIEPPPSSDPRAAMAVSPIYLESLRTFEHFASSDHLFARAAAKFNLRTGSWSDRAIEDLKRAVLRVSIPRNTKVLEISATLPDAGKAHALALYLAEQTMELNRQAGSASDRGLLEAAEHEFARTAAQVQQAQNALTKAMQSSPAEGDAALEKLEERRNEVERLSLSASLALEEMESRQKSASTDEQEWIRSRLSAARGRVERLRNESAKVTQEIFERRRSFAQRAAEVNLRSREYETAREAHVAAERRLSDARGTAGRRNEQIGMLDPGVVPERPSSPNVPLNMTMALVLGLALALVMITIDFNMRNGSANVTRKLPRVVGRP
jgi:uncharacterized protein involved in exopolysaccharide biosynthesis